MPKRTDLQSILIIGAGPIVIGQACEFDYSGAQACKALREEGYRVILVNSNPATIMTDPSMADATYIEPIHWQMLEKIIAQERPDALLPTMGGQTALNCALDLAREGVLAKYGVEMIGATQDAIDKAEDRERFDQAMKAIGLNTPRSAIAHSIEEAYQVLDSIGFPAIIRPSFTMGGSGGGIAYNREDFDAICHRGLDLSPTSELLIDESLIGWKEFEMEVVRDKHDNCVIICSIENLDPMGVHTGDSITVAPAQTLTDKEYQMMRNASIKVLREIGIETGGSNVQFAQCPQTGRLVVIEMNPRVSRSSALASKATGFPIAKVAAKLAIGYTLDELHNDITGGATPASFEPSIDYVVTKLPRFTFEKFPEADTRLHTQMKSVGEVMAIGRTFQESLQKALRGLEVGSAGFEPRVDMAQVDVRDRLISALNDPRPDRLWYVADAFRAGMSLEEVHGYSHIDIWFLAAIKAIIDHEYTLQGMVLNDLDAEYLFTLKRSGFSDKRLAMLLNISEQQMRDYRHALEIRPVYKRVDTCAAEFPTSTAYMYSTYEPRVHANSCEAKPTNRRKIVILGGGPNRIGQGIEFDYCCVHAALAMRDAGFETIMVNCNPETVSTDYDTSDRLYFEPVTLEDVLAIIELEKPQGVMLQFGGQTPLNLAQALQESGVPILGTPPDAIDRAEDRQRFGQVVEKLALKQPANATVCSMDEALTAANAIGYPLMVRPSYVLGGRAMEVVHNDSELQRYMHEVMGYQEGQQVSILLDHFLDAAVEVDIDAVADGKQVVIGAIMQHIEQAGIHSGDSACSLPPYSIDVNQQDRIREQVKAMAIELGVCGLMNVQMALQGDQLYVIEVNPRASRTVPFVSKCIGQSLAAIAARCMVGVSLADQNFTQEIVPSYYSVKEAVFPFGKFPQVDPILGPEMKSTGEVMGVGRDFAQAYAKAQWAAGSTLPTSGTAFISVREADKPELITLAQQMVALGFKLVATRGSYQCIRDAGIDCEPVNKVKEGRPHIVDHLKNGDISLIINTTEGRQAIADSASIRRTALQKHVFYTTTLAGGLAVCEAIRAGSDLPVYRLQTLHTQDRKLH